MKSTRRERLYMHFEIAREHGSRFEPKTTSPGSVSCNTESRDEVEHCALRPSGGQNGLLSCLTPFLATTRGGRSVQRHCSGPDRYHESRRPYSGGPSRSQTSFFSTRAGRSLVTTLHRVAVFDLRACCSRLPARVGT